MTSSCSCSVFFFNDTAPTEIYSLPLHDALPIWRPCRARAHGRPDRAPGPRASSRAPGRTPRYRSAASHRRRAAWRAGSRGAWARRQAGHEPWPGTRRLGRSPPGPRSGGSCPCAPGEPRPAAAGPRRGSPSPDTPCWHRTGWTRRRPARGGGWSRPAARSCSRPRRPRRALVPRMLSLAQPQIGALVSRVPMPSDNLAGRTIAGYRLLERVGEGGTAEVYRAQHAERGACAFKVLRSGLRSDPTAIKRFLREAGYGARVQHPGVVRTYDYGETEGLHYLALEWADGKSLAEYVHRTGPLAPALVADLVGQLAAALAAAHQAGDRK